MDTVSSVHHAEERLHQCSKKNSLHDIHNQRANKKEQGENDPSHVQNPMFPQRPPCGWKFKNIHKSESIKVISKEQHRRCFSEKAAYKQARPFLSLSAVDLESFQVSFLSFTIWLTLSCILHPAANGAASCMQKHPARFHSFYPNRII